MEGGMVIHGVGLFGCGSNGRGNCWVRGVFEREQIAFGANRVEESDQAVDCLKDRYKFLARNEEDVTIFEI